MRSTEEELMNQQITVMKFGGTSIGTPERIKRVAQYVIAAHNRGGVVVVVSAMGDTTDEILNLFQKTCPTAPRRELDQALATGEQLSSALLAGTLSAAGANAKSLAAGQMRLTASGAHGQGRIRAVEGADQMLSEIRSGTILVCAGFQGVTRENDTITLGRGGSDTSAVALAHALKASCEIYTDVRGVFAVDPRIVPSAKRLEFISYDDMISMSSAGAGVLMDRAVMLARDLGVPLRVKLSPSYGKPDEGTLVSFRQNQAEIETNDLAQTGLAIKTRVAVVTIPNLPNTPGQAAKVFARLREVVIGDAVQGTSGKRASVSIWVSEEDLPRVQSVIEGCEVRAGMACLTLVSAAMKEGSGYLARFTGALSRAKANIEMLSTAGTSMLAIIKQREINAGANAVAKEFSLCD